MQFKNLSEFFRRKEKRKAPADGFPENHKGILLGVVHPLSLDNIESLEALIEAYPKYRVSYRASLKHLDELARRKPGSTILIETPETHDGNEHSFFGLLAKEAKARGLKVESYCPEKTLLRKIDGYEELMRTYEDGGGIPDFVSEVKKLAKKYGMPELKKMSYPEAQKRVWLVPQIMSNFLLKRILMKKYRLVIAGNAHIRDVAPLASEYENRTPKELEKWTLKRWKRNRRHMERNAPGIIETLEAHRKRIALRDPKAVEPEYRSLKR